MNTVDRVQVQRALQDLRDSWSSAYTITYEGDTDKPWRAKRRDDTTVVLRADTSEDLRSLIWEDYSKTPMSRTVT